MTERGHRQLDHTGDLALEFWAPTEEGLYLEGARAIVSILTEGGRQPEARDRRALGIEALDAEDRIVQWLNEVLVLAITDGFLFATAELVFDPEDDRRLQGEIIGEAGAGDHVQTELKSVTYHDLLVEKTEAGFRARVVIDV